MTVTDVQDTTEEQEKDPKRSAYSAATSRLRDAHREDFNELLKDEMAKRGIEWSPRPSEEEKAEQDIARLLEQFPDLRVKFQTEQ